MNFAALILLASVSLAFAEQPRVIVNGKDVSADVVQINGRFYLPVESLGASVMLQSNEVRIAAPTPVIITEPAAEPIHGILTWNAGVFKDNPPDFGAKVWLLRENEVARLANEAGGTITEPIPIGATGWPAKLDAMFPKTIADGNGKFAFTNIAPGNYLLIYLSKRANGLAARDRAGKMRFKPITIAGQPVDASYDFGVTAYRN
jgi:hypothetical protein